MHSMLLTFLMKFPLFLFRWPIGNMEYVDFPSLRLNKKAAIATIFTIMKQSELVL